MKPPPFSYVRAQTLEDAVDMLSGSNGEAKVIAGGQSLMPMLNFRLLAPDTLGSTSAACLNWRASAKTTRALSLARASGIASFLKAHCSLHGFRSSRKR